MASSDERNEILRLMQMGIGQRYACDGQPSPYYPKAGDRYGGLTLVSSVHTRGYGRLWTCRCDCGGKRNILSGDLNHLGRNGQFAGCLTCVERLRQLLGEHSRKRFNQNCLKLWKVSGSLYWPGQEQDMERQVRENLEEVFGLTVENVEEYMTPPREGEATWTPPVGELVSLVVSGVSIWRCTACHGEFDRVHLCRRCGAVLCSTCRGQRSEHYCPPAETYSLEEVAHQYGLTRERIRQIEEGALEKLANPKHRRRLMGVLRGYLPPVTPARRTAWAAGAARKEYRTRVEIKPCPSCERAVWNGAPLCRHCGHRLPVRGYPPAQYRPELPVVHPVASVAGADVAQGVARAMRATEEPPLDGVDGHAQEGVLRS